MATNTTDATQATDDMGARLIEAFNHLAEGGVARLDAALDEISGLYAPEMVFADPLKRCEGRDEFIEMNRQMVRASRTLAFTFHEHSESEGALFVAWTMRIAPRFGPAMTIPGVTHATLRKGLIVRHIDHWDALGAFIGTVPGLRRTWNAFASRVF